MNLRPGVLAAPPYSFSARPETIKLDQNESPYDLPALLKARVLERLAELPFNRYPEINAQTLRSKLAASLEWPEDGLVLSGGSNILISALVTAAGVGSTVLTVAPTFSVYRLQAKLQGADLVECHLEPGFGLPLTRLEQELSRGNGVFFLACPAAPTGNLLSREDLETLARASAQNWLFVIDEAYYQFADSDFSDLVRRFEHVVSLRTFSKAYGLGGIRLGYALAQPKLAEQLQKVILPFSISALQLAVGETVLDAPNYVADRITETRRERERMYQHLQALEDLEVFPSAANFLLFRVADPEGFYKGLLEHDIVVRRQDHVEGLAGCLRVSVGTPSENDAFLEAATALLQEREAVRG